MSVNKNGTAFSTARNKTLERIIIYIYSKHFNITFESIINIYLKYRNLAERERALCKIECQYHNQIRA